MFVTMLYKYGFIVAKMKIILFDLNRDGYLDSEHEE